MFKSTKKSSTYLTTRTTGASSKSLKKESSNFDTNILQSTGAPHAPIQIPFCVAPVLCNISLAKFDRPLLRFLDDTRVVRVGRYVDDFLVLLSIGPNDSYHNIVEVIFGVFRRSSSHLKFSHELTTHDSIHFLDLLLTFLGEGHVCWMYSPGTTKGLLPYDLNHSKLVKRGIAKACFLNSAKKSCCHTVTKSIATQAERLSDAGFPAKMMATVAESVLKEWLGLK